MENERDLVRLCLNAACQSKESVDKWRRQRRSLERLPSHLADAFLRQLIHRRLLFPSLLEVFKHSVETIDLRGHNSVDAEWMAYIGAFCCLQTLNLADCHRINSSALWALSGMTSLKELDLSRCTKVTDAGIKHLLSISTLEKLWIPQTGVTPKGVTLLSSLGNLSVLDLGGLPVTDATLKSLKVLTKLQYLDLWGSNVSDEGVTILPLFTELRFLNLAWTNVTNVPAMSSLECLNLSNCNIKSILEENGGDKARLTKLVVSGSTFANEAEAFLHIEKSFITLLDISNSSLTRFTFLPLMNSLEYLNLSSNTFGDDSVELIVSIGARLKDLNLSKTRVSSAGVGVLAGRVPYLETLSLSHTAIDDTAISYISMMSSLKDVDLSNTNIRGYIQQLGAEQVLSLTMLENLNSLERLNLEHTQIKDDVLHHLSGVPNLKHLYLKSPSLTDNALYRMSSLSKLTNLTIRDAVLTSYALASFMAPTTLQVMDLRGCWLLTEDIISSFCRTHPQIEVKHELARISPSEQFSSPSPSQISSKTTPSDKRKEKMPMSCSFVDQRLKYSREELLSLQFSALSLVYPHNSGIVRPETEYRAFLHML